MAEDEGELPLHEGQEERLSVWAKNQSELADALECDRKSIQRWLKEGDPECPGKTPDGRYNVTLWKLWIAKKGKKVRANTRSKSKSDLEIEHLTLKNEKIELENMIRRGELLHIDEVNKTLSEMMAGFVQHLRKLRHTLSPSVIGVSLPEATKRISTSVDEVLGEMALGEWAKKKPFWSSVSATLSDLHRKHGLGDGLSDT